MAGAYTPYVRRVKRTLVIFLAKHKNYDLNFKSNTVAFALVVTSRGTEKVTT